MQTRHSIIRRDELCLARVDLREPAFDLGGPRILGVRVDFDVETLDQLCIQLHMVIFAERERVSEDLCIERIIDDKIALRIRRSGPPFRVGFLWPTLMP
jgi:hypothetical protein